MTKNISYLITGGYGLIGSAIANATRGDITIVTRSKKNSRRITKKISKVLLKDIHQLEKNDLNNIDIIYHCASTVDNYNVLTDPYIDAHTNIDGTIALLELCKDFPKKPKIIFLSTFFVYGEEYDRTKIPINEESKTDPRALYPATKLCVESIIKLYSRLYGVPYLICRLTNVYSENEDYNNKKKGALNYLIMQAVIGNDLHIYKGGNFLRDYIFLDDVIEALKTIEQNQINETFLIGYGKSVLFREIIDSIHSNTGNKSKIIEMQPPAFHNAVGITNFVADTSKISSLGWKPKIDYKEGVKRIVGKYKAIIR